MLARRPEAMIVTFDDHTARAQTAQAVRCAVIEIWEMVARS
jgi:hypothetical protein